MIRVLVILAGFILDLIFGDPYRFPHPVKYIGKFIAFLEPRLRKMNADKAAGILLVVIIVGSVAILTHILSSIPLISIIIQIILIYTVFSVKALGAEAKKIYVSLQCNDVEKARTQISLLVSRDTINMKEEDIVRAAIETVSENMVDGIIAPMFYLFIGGVTSGMAYKAASTLDSMVGYKNDKYIRFGWAGARLDDILNFIPARITGLLLIPAASFFCRFNTRNSFRIACRDRLNHASPNSAHSEAAAAGALGIRLGGPTSYFGKMQDKPYIGDKLKKIDKDDILRVIKLMYATVILGVILGSIILLTISVLIF